MLDFNSRSTIAERVNGLIDAAIQANRRAQTPRTYLGASRLGVACQRALQFEYAHAPRDPDQEEPAWLLRTFQAGHAFEDLAITWLRAAGFDLYTTKGNRPGGEQFGFSVLDGLIQGHVDGILAGGPAELDLGYPAIWECKALNDKSWRDVVKRGVVIAKPVYAAQIALYQAYMEGTIEGVAQNPALFTAVNKNTSALHHELLPFDAVLAQTTSDRAVRIIQATHAGELLPRIALSPDHQECRQCPWAVRCWG